MFLGYTAEKLCYEILLYRYQHVTETNTATSKCNSLAAPSKSCLYLYSNTICNGRDTRQEGRTDLVGAEGKLLANSIYELNGQASRQKKPTTVTGLEKRRA